VKPTNVDEAGFFSGLGSTVTPYLGLTFFFSFFWSPSCNQPSQLEFTAMDAWKGSFAQNQLEKFGWNKYVLYQYRHVATSSP
jgi:hypothetical protein